MSENNICTACGTEFPTRGKLPEFCRICSDDRQYIPDGGQSWTSFDELSNNYDVATGKIDDRLYSLKMTPLFAIGQRALLATTPEGNILWDCLPLLDTPTIEFIRSKGGLRAIAFSHPHFYSTMNRWAETFDCPIFIHQADERWIVNRGARVYLWSGVEKELWDGMTLVNIGGHFPGSSVLRVPFLGARGALLCGDTFVISPSRQHVAAMHSYPNRIPLPVKEIERIRHELGGLEFDTIYGWNDSQNIYSDAREIVENSLAKYV
jgi:glyoxylase-like metal-dependent hydrolase (beta-lactamase superfamily II)